MNTLSIQLALHQKIRIREAVRADVNDVWRWRNDKVARANSLDDRKISFREHKTWFINQLKNENVKLFIATKHRAKIGVVRFDFLANNTIEVSINMNPLYRGKGFGKRVLELVSNFIDLKYNSRPQKAIIKTFNLASERIFEAAGFIKMFGVNDPGYSVWVKNNLITCPPKDFIYGEQLARLESGGMAPKTK